MNQKIAHIGIEGISNLFPEGEVKKLLLSTLRDIEKIGLVGSLNFTNLVDTKDAKPDEKVGKIVEKISRIKDDLRDEAMGILESESIEVNRGDNRDIEFLVESIDKVTNAEVQSKLKEYFGAINELVAHIGGLGGLQYLYNRVYSKIEGMFPEGEITDMLMSTLIGLEKRLGKELQTTINLEELSSYETSKEKVNYIMSCYEKELILVKQEFREQVQQVPQIDHLAGNKDPFSTVRQALEKSDIDPNDMQKLNHLLGKYDIIIGSRAALGGAANLYRMAEEKQD